VTVMHPQRQQFFTFTLQWIHTLLSSLSALDVQFSYQRSNVTYSRPFTLLQRFQD